MLKTCPSHLSFLISLGKILQLQCLVSWLQNNCVSSPSPASCPFSSSHHLVKESFKKLLTIICTHIELHTHIHFCTMLTNINPTNKPSSTTFKCGFKLTGNKCHPFGDALALTCSIISEVGGFFSSHPFIWSQISIYNKNISSRMVEGYKKKVQKKQHFSIHVAVMVCRLQMLR